jgi:hypothetical protein
VVTDWEGQLIVEARGLWFSVLQVNKLGHCMLLSRVRCGRFSWIVVVKTAVEFCLAVQNSP